MLEIKKSKAADLESRKLTGFLLGLVVALTLCFGALEFTTHPDTADGFDDVLDVFDEDIEKIPVIDRKDMVAAVEKTASAPAVTENLNEVAQPVDGNEMDKADLGERSDGVSAVNTETVPEEVEHKTVALPPVLPGGNDNPLDWRVVEELPEFPGGMVEFMKWLTKNLKYPPAAKSQKIQGKVVVQFVVNKNGTVSDAKIINSVEPSLDREALRVVGMMPKWSPGKMDGATCRTLFVIPIVFKL